MGWMGHGAVCAAWRLGAKVSIWAPGDKAALSVVCVASPPPQSSSICRAAIHYGVLDDNGGLVDITRNGRMPFFVKSHKNGIESVR